MTEHLDEAQPAESRGKLTCGTYHLSNVACADMTYRGEELVHPKRLSNTRRRQPTPSLMLKPAGSGKPTQAKSREPPCPFVHEDDDDDDAGNVPNDPPLEPAAAQAPASLREISPNASQGSRQVEKPTKEDLPLDKAQPVLPPKSPARERTPVKEAKKLASDLAAIVRLQRDVSGHELAIEPQKRKQRTLGRNLSGTSLTTLPARQNSTSGSPAIIEEGCEADGFAPSHEPAALPPGTQLEYGESNGKRVASMGTVKDSEDIARKSLAVGAAAAAGGRTKARARAKT